MYAMMKNQQQLVTQPNQPNFQPLTTNLPLRTTTIPPLTQAQSPVRSEPISSLPFISQPDPPVNLGANPTSLHSPSAQSTPTIPPILPTAQSTPIDLESCGVASNSNPDSSHRHSVEDAQSL